MKMKQRFGMWQSTDLSAMNMLIYFVHSVLILISHANTFHNLLQPDSLTWTNFSKKNERISMKIGMKQPKLYNVHHSDTLTHIHIHTHTFSVLLALFVHIPCGSWTICFQYIHLYMYTKHFNVYRNNNKLATRRKTTADATIAFHWKERL